MPGTATKNEKPTSKRTTRLSAPVLFRLPAIQTHRTDDAIEEAPVPAPELDYSSTQSTVAELELATPALATPALSLEIEKAQTATEEESTPSPTAPVLAGSDASEPSWWEHWSSGVVLVLLVVALVTATVIAFMDSLDGNPAELANAKQGEGETEAANLEELETIPVPILAIEESEQAQALATTPSPDLQLSPTATLASEAKEVPMEAADLSLEPRIEIPPMQTPQPAIELDLASEPLQLTQPDSAESQPNTLIPESMSANLGDFYPADNSSSSNAILLPTSGPQENQGTQVTLDTPQEARSDLFQGEETQLSFPDLPNHEGTVTPAEPSPYVTAQHGELPNYSTASHSSDSAKDTTSSSGTEESAPLTPPVKRDGITETSTPDMDLDSFLRAYREFRAKAQ